MRGGSALAASLAAAGTLAAGAAAADAPEPAGRAPVDATASITPREHFFADRVTARVVVTVDRRAVDPEGVRLLARFRPYRPLGAIERARRDLDGTTIVTFTVALQCIDRGCLAAGMRGLAPAVVQYFTREDPAPVGVQAAWPETAIARRVRTPPAGAPARGGAAELPAVSYRTAPALLGWLLAAGAGLLALGAGGAAALRLRGRAPRVRPEPARPADPLVAVLALVERAVDDDARRMALDALAVSLSDDGLAPLAARARELAWRPAAPPPAEARRLAAEVRGALEERR